MNACERIASDALLDVARSWVSIDSPDVEMNPREMALWLASWRSDLADRLDQTGQVPDGPSGVLVAEAMAVDGNCAPLEFVEWFIDWRERTMDTLAAEGRGSEIAGAHLHAALSLIVFQFEDDLGEELLSVARAAMVEIEGEDFVSAGCSRAEEVLERLLDAVSGLPARPDVITRVYSDLIVAAARRHLSEYKRFLGE